MKGSVCLDEAMPCQCLFRQVLQYCGKSRMTHDDKERITLQKQWQERNEEDQENRDDTTPDPVKYWDEIIASGLSSDNSSYAVHFANCQLLVQRTDEEHCLHD